MQKNKIIGIILLVLGILSVIGATANGTYAGYAAGIGVADIVSLALQVFLVAGGIVLIVKNSAKKG